MDDAIRTAMRKMKHGYTIRGHRSKEYDSWHHMMNRCYSSKDKRFSHYGGRGITVCDKWRNSPQVFIEDMGPCPPGYTLERKDNNQGYSPENCKWATRLEQANNKKNSVTVNIGGVKKTVAQAARESGIGYAAMYYRVKVSKYPNKDLTRPVQ